MGCDKRGVIAVQEGASMPDPVTLGVVGGWAAAEGVKFLYGQAAELLKVWRERRSRTEAGETLPAQVVVPIIGNDVLDGAPTEQVVDVDLLGRENKALVQLVGALAPYANGLADIDPADQDLADQAGRLRALLEAAYGQRLTFLGESRPPTGTRVSVTQVLDEVRGAVVGAEADVAAGGAVTVDQRITEVRADGSVTGFKGRIGG
jgi:hypothetical protein